MRERSDTERNWRTAEPRTPSHRHAGEQFRSESQGGEDAFDDNQFTREEGGEHDYRGNLVADTPPGLAPGAGYRPGLPQRGYSQGNVDPAPQGRARRNWEENRGDDYERGSWEAARTGWREGYGSYGTGERGGAARRAGRYEGPPGYAAGTPGFEHGFQHYRGGTYGGYGAPRGGEWVPEPGWERQNEQVSGSGWGGTAGLDAQSGRAGEWYSGAPQRGRSGPSGEPTSGFGYGGGVTGYGEWGGMGERGPFAAERGRGGYGAPWGSPAGAQQGGYRGEEGGAGRDWSAPRGGERGGNEPWHVPGPYSGRGPQGYQRSESAIREDVCERLTRHGQVDASRIQVRVEGGEVILEGTVADRRAKRLAEETAESVSGVRDVQNRLRVSERGQRGLSWHTDDDEAERETGTEAS